MSVTELRLYLEKEFLYFYNSIGIRKAPGTVISVITTGHEYTMQYTDRHIT